MKILTTLLLLIISFSCFSQDVVYVKMKSYKKPIVQAEINGKKGYFLIDTGADISIINQRELKRYKLNAVQSYGDHRRAIAFNGESTNAMKVKDVRVLFEERFEHSTFYCLDISAVVATIESKTSLKISGILGSDWLMKYHCVIDYNQRRVVLVDSKTKNTLAKQ